jgi:uncharacterized protein (DUF4415 family)
MTEYSIHPAADLFPMMKDDELDALAADIKANGQQQPIAVHRDLVLDGRNRLAACSRAGVNPIYQEVETDNPIAFVISANIHRRHLTTRQRAAIAAELANMKSGTRTDLPSFDRRSESEPVTSATQAAELMGVSTSSVERAKKTMRDDPEAHEAAKRGEKPREQMTSKAAGDFWRLVASSCYEQETGQKRSDKWFTQSIRPMLEERLPWFKEKDKRSLLTESQAEEVRQVIREIADSERAAAAEPLAAQSEEAAAALSKTAQEKLETAIRVHKRLADREFDERVRAEVTRRLDEDVLPTYAEEYERYKAFNDAWRGVFSHQEYKTLKGFLHPDRHPNEPDKAARLFRLVNEKEEILCGIKESVKNSRPATLPQTVAELMKRREQKVH